MMLFLLNLYKNYKFLMNLQSLHKLYTMHLFDIIVLNLHTKDKFHLEFLCQLRFQYHYK